MITVKHSLYSMCYSSRSSLADFEGGQFEVPYDVDVADDFSAITVRKLNLLSIRELHFKHVSSQFQHNLKQRTYLEYFLFTQSQTHFL